MKRKIVIGVAITVGLGVAAFVVYAIWGGLWGSQSSAAATAGQHVGRDGSEAKKSGERKVLYWVDPMNPSRKSDKPGKAPDGMDLVPVYAEEEDSGMTAPPGSVKINAERQQLIGVQYGEVAYGPIARSIRAVGRVAYDETKIARIHTKIDGWLEKVYVDFTGKLVEKNQPLVSIYSPDLVATQQEFLIARRAKDYLGDNQDKQIAGNALSLYDAARDRLRLWDISEEQIRDLEARGTPTRTLTLYSPMTGFVLARNAYERQRVTTETELYTIADLSTVWVLADIYEYELPMIRLGQTATMSLAYYPGKTFTGTVSYIYPQLDNTTRTLKVRLEFANPELVLKPDMYANVELQIQYGAQMSVPEEAVLDSGQEQIVFVAHENGYFEPRKITLGARLEDRYIVLSGLKPGEKIVTSGNFLIDSESKLKSATGAMAGMGHGGGKGGSEQKAAAPAAPEKKQEANPPHEHQR